MPIFSASPRVLALRLLCACASVLPTTAARLVAFDPVTVDPGEIEVAVILPQGLAATPGSARLELGAPRGSEHLQGSFVLQDIPAEAAVTAPKGSTARIFLLTETNADRMQGLPRQIAA
jgi:hypothetical protein